MSSYLRVKGKDKVIEIDDKYITKVEFSYDSPDETGSKATESVIILRVEGVILQDSCKDIEGIFNWAILNSGDTYRRVDLQIVSSDKKVLRYYTFPDAFVVDYKETNVTKEGETKFILKIKQKNDRQSGIKANSGYDFDKENKWCD